MSKLNILSSIDMEQIAQDISIQWSLDDIVDFVKFLDQAVENWYFTGQMYEYFINEMYEYKKLQDNEDEIRSN